MWEVWKFPKELNKAYSLVWIELSKWVGTREPIRLTTGSDRIRLKFFYKFQYGLIFDPAHPEPGSLGTRGEPDW